MEYPYTMHINLLLLVMSWRTYNSNYAVKHIFKVPWCLACNYWKNVLPIKLLNEYWYTSYHYTEHNLHENFWCTIPGKWTVKSFLYSAFYNWNWDFVNFWYIMMPHKISKYEAFQFCYSCAQRITELHSQGLFSNICLYVCSLLLVTSFHLYWWNCTQRITK